MKRVTMLHDVRQMRSNKGDQAKKARFHIEKLEERIAPAKGGIPGPPDGGGGGGCGPRDRPPCGR